jgi:uncharacterized membrane protein
VTSRPVDRSERRLVWLLVVLGVVALLLTACAAGPNPQTGTAGGGGLVAGFWLGLWHGVIAPVTFVISLFATDVGIYEVHNVGAWYDFGFVLGLGFIVGGGSSGVRGARR